MYALFICLGIYTEIFARQSVKGTDTNYEALYLLF